MLFHLGDDKPQPCLFDMGYIHCIVLKIDPNLDHIWDGSIILQVRPRQAWWDVMSTETPQPEGHNKYLYHNTSHLKTDLTMVHNFASI
jgi:hypothetical protein